MKSRNTYVSVIAVFAFALFNLTPEFSNDNSNGLSLKYLFENASAEDGEDDFPNLLDPIDVTTKGNPYESSCRYFSTTHHVNGAVNIGLDLGVSAGTGYSTVELRGTHVVCPSDTDELCHSLECH